MISFILLPAAATAAELQRMQAEGGKTKFCTFAN